MWRTKILLITMLAISVMVVTSCGKDSSANPIPSGNAASKNFQLSTSVDPAGGGNVNPNNGQYASGASVTLVATPGNYYEFNGWAGDISGNTNLKTITMDSNKNVIASFKKIQYSLKLNVDSAGSGTLDPSSGNYDAGSQIKITATPSNGYRFDHWGGSATGTSNQVSVVMDNNKTITSYFMRQYSLKITSNPSDGGTINQGNGVFDAGKEVILSATQIFPYAFNNWSGTADDNANPTKAIMDSDKSISCNFVKTHIAGDWVKQSGPIYS